ncbi:MAG: sensor histidine kinase [Halorhabdus sp.]
MGDERRGQSRTDPPEERVEVRLAKALLPGFVRRRYAAKFVLTLLVVACIVAALGGFTYLEVREITQEDAEQTLRSTATLQADNVAEWLASMRSHAIAASATDTYATGDTERIRALLTTLNNQSTDVTRIHYVDETGVIAVSTASAAEGTRPNAISPGLAAPVEAVTTGPDAPRTSVSTAYERRGQLVMAFASQVQRGPGVVVVVANVGADVAQLHRERSVVATRVLDPDGHGVLEPRSDRVSDLADTAAFRTALAGTTTLLETDTEVVALAPIPGTEWVVQTEAPRGSLYAASRSVQRNVIALVGATLLTVLAIAVVLGRQTVLPLVRLRRRTEEMADGDLTVELHSAREDEIGDLYESLSRMRDSLREQITEAEQARETAEQARRELERQNERLETVAGTVSHDIRNPLTVARGNVELLREDIDDEAETEVAAIEDALDRMETIIEDVLALARQGTTIEATERVELETVAEDAWSSVATRDATLSIADTRPIDADRERLRRLLENLFRNAVEHAGTDVTVEVGVTDDGFYVADDGPGIPPGNRAEIFEYGHTTEPEGTGLGLSIVETIADAHGWSVTVENDGGARFDVIVFNSDTER